MPSGYAHYIFGEKVFDSLDKEMKARIGAYKQLFYIGLHGPDIFFYYRPYFFKNKIMSYGFKMHKDKAIDFFDTSRKIITSRKKSSTLEKGGNLQDVEAGFSYLAGFICHFMLDSECHPYITEQANLGVAGHFESEAEFDRYLLSKEGKEPLTANITSHIVISKKNVRLIKKFFTFSEKQVKDSIYSMTKVLKMLQAPKKWKRMLLKAGFRFTGPYYDKLSGLLMPEQANKACKGIDVELERRLVQAINPTVMLIQDYFDKFYTEEELNKRFQRNYK